MKILTYELDSNINIIQKNLNKYVNNVSIDIKKYITLDTKSLTIVIDGVYLGLLNAIRHIAYKFDYAYHLSSDISAIYVKSLKKVNVNSNSVNKNEVLNRLNSVIIDNNDEDFINEHLNVNVGSVKKRIEYYTDNLYGYVKTSDIDFTVNGLVTLDKNINLCMLPYIRGEFNIENVVIKKTYNSVDLRYTNVSKFTILPLRPDGSVNIDEYSFNDLCTKFKLSLTSTGYLDVKNILPRYFNIAYIKIQEGYVKNEDHILFTQKGLFLENLLVEYCYNNDLHVICKLNANVDELYCYNVTAAEIDRIIDIIKKDIITFVSLLLKIKFTDAEHKLDKNEFAKNYY